MIKICVYKHINAYLKNNHNIEKSVYLIDINIEKSVK